MTASILTSAAPVATLAGQRHLTRASGFSFERDGRLFRATGPHVMTDEPSRHFPDRIEIDRRAARRRIDAEGCTSIACRPTGTRLPRDHPAMEECTPFRSPEPTISVKPKRPEQT
jgi:hypothetical protein